MSVIIDFYITIFIISWVVFLVKDIMGFKVTITLNSLFSGFYTDCIIKALFWPVVYLYYLLSYLTHLTNLNEYFENFVEKIFGIPLKKFNKTN